jgi:signal transduction histidine kinase
MIAEIREKSPETPVIVVSGTGMVRDAVDSLRLGAWDYVIKPVEDNDVLDIVIKRALEKARLIKENRRYREHLEYLNKTLEERVREEVAKNREKDVILIQQNRQAAMGEILDHIAHQWKQPLNTISLITYLLKEDALLTKAEVSETADKILDQVDHMSQTLKVFRDFYRPDKGKSVFFVKESIERAISFIVTALQVESVKVEIEADPDLAALGYPKEFAQVILNLVSNARDAFREKKVEKPELIIRAFTEKNLVVVTVTDNGGGICEANLGRIFDLNFTTKGESGGTGVGLHMSRRIIEKNMGGILSVRNVDQGAQFRIEISAPTNPGSSIQIIP